MDFFQALSIIFNFILVIVIFFLSLLTLHIANRILNIKFSLTRLLLGLIFFSIFSVFGIPVSQYIQYRICWVYPDNIVLFYTLILEVLLSSIIAIGIIYGRSIHFKYRVLLSILLPTIVYGAGIVIAGIFLKVMFN